MQNFNNAGDSPSDIADTHADAVDAGRTNSLIASLAAGNGFGSNYNPLPPGEYPPNRPGGGPIPIGGEAQAVSNLNGNKFTRGWLSGAGGADIEHTFGSLAQSIRPAPYNDSIGAQFRGVVASHGAPVAGLANWDVNAPGREPGCASTKLAAAEWVPTTFDSRLNGLDVTTGFVGPRVFTADQGIIKAPTSQFCGEFQTGVGAPENVAAYDVSFGAKPSPQLWRAPPKANGRGIFAGM